MERTLYHFTRSPFSRRTRLALAHKSLEVALRDTRENPAWLVEAHKLTPFRTMPVLVEPGGEALGDSNAIAHYLDRAFPNAPLLWPTVDAHAAFEVAALVDVALNPLVDLGSRYFALSADPAWGSVKTELVGRAQRALDALAARADSIGTATVSRSGWCAADMWLYTAVEWLETLPTRLGASPIIAQVCGLGWVLPPALSRWADAHRDRGDVRALRGEQPR